MRLRFCIIASAILMGLAGIQASAQDGSVTEAFTFLRLDRSPVTSALAGAGFSMTGENDAYAAFGNPAAAAFMTNRATAAISYRYWSPEILKEHHVTASFTVKPFEKLAVQAGFAKGIQPVLEEGDTFHANDNNFALGVSYAFTDMISFGVNGHYAYQELVKGYKLQDFAFDAVAQFHAWGFNAAAGVVSIGPKVVSQESGAYPIPASAIIAADYTLDLNTVKLTFASNADYYFSGKMAVSAGASLAIADIAYIRAGGRYASEGCAVPSHLAVGGGVKLGPAKLDVSYVTLNSIIGNSLMGGLSISF